MNGYPPGVDVQADCAETCGTCRHLHGTSFVLKCRLNQQRWTFDSSTDVTLETPACNRWSRQSPHFDRTPAHETQDRCESCEHFILGYLGTGKDVYCGYVCGVVYIAHQHYTLPLNSLAIACEHFSSSHARPSDGEVV